jgi:2-iminobutanoate/2-iminopropanoate deaminase
MINTVNTHLAPKAIGPYSQASRVGNTLYLSGQIALDPVALELVPGGVAHETHQVMKNLAAVLQAGSLGWSHVAKFSVYLANMDDFATVNEVMMQYIKPPYPARVAYQVAALPKGALVEIEAIAAYSGEAS